MGLYLAMDIILPVLVLAIELVLHLIRLSFVVATHSRSLTSVKRLIFFVILLPLILLYLSSIVLRQVGLDLLSLVLILILEMFFLVVVVVLLVLVLLFLLLLELLL